MSFEEPESTADVDVIGTLRILEALRLLGMTEKPRFYPRSPYGVAKLYAYWIVVNYREPYGMNACNGILLNHESPRRGETFVNRKITAGLANISQGLENFLFMGNLDALCDWGHAGDYVGVQWLMLQQGQSRLFVIATGRQTSVRDFIECSAQQLVITLQFSGGGARRDRPCKRN